MAIVWPPSPVPSRACILRRKLWVDSRPNLPIIFFWVECVVLYAHFLTHQRDVSCLLWRRRPPWQQRPEACEHGRTHALSLSGSCAEPRPQPLPPSRDLRQVEIQQQRADIEGMAAEAETMRAERERVAAERREALELEQAQRAQWAQEQRMLMDQMAVQHRALMDQTKALREVRAPVPPPPHLAPSATLHHASLWDRDGWCTLVCSAVLVFVCSHAGEQIFPGLCM